MIKAIIFDWHGVLDKIKFEGLVEKLSELTSKEMAEVKAVISVIERKYAVGTLSPKDFWRQVQELLGLSNDQLHSASSYITSIVLNDKLWGIMEELKSNYNLSILSDCPLDKVEKIKQKADLNYFSPLYFSSEKNLLKTDDVFFTNHIKELGLSPDECLYIDDQQKHVDTARRLGMKGLKYDQEVDLKHFLSLI